MDTCAREEIPRGRWSLDNPHRYILGIENIKYHAQHIVFKRRRKFQREKKILKELIHQLALDWKPPR